MKKLTDEVVAKALGWRSLDPKAKDQRNHYWVSKRGLDGTQILGVPTFTTNLEVIMAAIVEQKLFGRVETVWGAMSSLLYFHAQVAGHEAKGPTAALALCTALLAYFKERSDARHL